MRFTGTTLRENVPVIYGLPVELGLWKDHEEERREGQEHKRPSRCSSANYRRMCRLLEEADKGCEASLCESNNILHRCGESYEGGCSIHLH